MDKTESVRDILKAVEVYARLQELIEKTDEAIEALINQGENESKEYISTKLKCFDDARVIYKLKSILNSLNPNYNLNSLEKNPEDHLALMRSMMSN